MGIRFNKRINLGHGLRINLSKSGVGFSAGGKGFRLTKMANGRIRSTTTIPNTGISYIKETSTHSAKQNQERSVPQMLKRHPNLKKIGYGFLIFFGILFWLSFVGTLIETVFFSHLESISITDVPKTMDVDQSTLVNVELDPSLFDKDDLEFVSEDSSIACFVLKDDEIYLESGKEGKTNVWIQWEDVKSDPVTVTVIDQEKQEREKQEALLAQQKQEQKEQEEQAAAAASSEQTQDLVWISSSGSGTKYHKNSNCSSMKNPVQIDKQQAVAQGYEPCKKCY